MGIGNRIKTIRKLANLNQKEMAKILEISHVSVGNIENEKNNISIENLKKLCEYYNIPADFILFGTDETETITKLMNRKEKE